MTMALRATARRTATRSDTPRKGPGPAALLAALLALSLSLRRPPARRMPTAGAATSSGGSSGAVGFAADAFPLLPGSFQGTADRRRPATARTARDRPSTIPTTRGAGPVARSTAATARTGTSTRLYMTTPKPLASEGDWSAYLDDAGTGLVYYFNARTGESRWVPPTTTFPPVTLPRDLKRKAEDKQREYRQAVAAAAATEVSQEQEVGGGGGGGGGEETKKKKGFFTALLEDDEEEEKVPAVEDTGGVKTEDQKEDQKQWFDFLAEGDTAQPKQEEPDWFSPLKRLGKRRGEAQQEQQQQPTTMSDDSSSGSLVEDDTARQQKTKKKDEADWFGWFKNKGETPAGGGGGGGTSDTYGIDTGAYAVDEEEGVVVEEDKTVEELITKPATRKRPAAAAAPAPAARGLLEKFAKKLTSDVETQKPRREEEAAVVVETTTKPAPAAATAAPTPTTKTTVVPEISAFVSPDPKKIFWGGEDAVFVAGRTFGVFDGVSGASKLDGVPLYSKTMATQMKQKVLNRQQENVQSLTIQQMTKALEEIVEYCNAKATGATTAIVGSISEDGYLRVLNVGDSACVVVRGSGGAAAPRVVARTREINHFYECPYQFSQISPDVPRDGTKLNFELKQGDIIIMGSDGVFDNLSNEDIIDVINACPTPKMAAVLAKRISDKARKVSFNPKAETPFSQLALKNKNPDYPTGLGGKVDDIGCVVVCYE